MFEPKHHITSGNNSQRRQQEDLLAVLVYIVVRAVAQCRLTEESFARRKLQRKQIFDALSNCAPRVNVVLSKRPNHVDVIVIDDVAHSVTGLQWTPGKVV